MKRRKNLVGKYERQEIVFVLYSISTVFCPVFARNALSSAYLPVFQIAMAAFNCANYEYLCMHCKPAKVSSAGYTPFTVSESACTIVISYFSLCSFIFPHASSLFSTSRAHLNVFVLTRSSCHNLIKQSTFAIFLLISVSFACFLHSIACLSPRL